MKKIHSLRSRLISFTNRYIRSLTWYKEFWGGATKFWNENQFGLDIVNLGSGAGVHSFNYEESGLSGRNWALGPQSIVHDFNILKNYFSFISENGVVLITICPFSCLKSKYDVAHNLKYYTFLHPASIDNFDEKERIKALKFKLSPITDRPIFCLKNTIKSVLGKCKGFVRRRENVDLACSANQMLEIWQRQFDISDLSAPLKVIHRQEQLERRDTLLEMIDFCKERSLQPVIVIPPMHRSLSQKFPKVFYSNYIKPLIRDIDIPIFNYMDKSEVQEDRYYKTALFLNKLGAKEFTKHLTESLYKEGIISYNNINSQ